MKWAWKVVLNLGSESQRSTYYTIFAEKKCAFLQCSECHTHDGNNFSTLFFNFSCQILVQYYVQDQKQGLFHSRFSATMTQLQFFTSFGDIIKATWSLWYMFIISFRRLYVLLTRRFLSRAKLMLYISCTQGLKPVDKIPSPKVSYSGKHLFYWWKSELFSKRIS